MVTSGSNQPSWRFDEDQRYYATFERLFKSHYEDLCRLAYSYLSFSADAENAVQDVFYSLWRRRYELNADLDTKAYLFKAVRNEALKQLEHSSVVRRHEEEVKDSITYLTDQPTHRLKREEVRDAIQKALGALPARRREIFLLSRQHGLTYREIAAILDISIKTVETQMGRALDFFERQLADFISARM